MEVKLNLENIEDSKKILNKKVVVEKKVKSDIIIDNSKYQKMLFFYNAINDGWNVRKNKDRYVFTKKHEGKKQIFDESYLLTFIKENLDINT